MGLARESRDEGKERVPGHRKSLCRGIASGEGWPEVKLVWTGNP